MIEPFSRHEDALRIALASQRVWSRYRALPWWRRLFTHRPDQFDVLQELPWTVIPAGTDQATQ